MAATVIVTATCWSIIAAFRMYFGRSDDVKGMGSGLCAILGAFIFGAMPFAATHFLSGAPVGMLAPLSLILAAIGADIGLAIRWAFVE